MDHPLRKARLKRGLTLEALATEAETTKATLSRIENGQRVPSLALAARLVAALDGAVRADDFLCGLPS